MPVFLNQHPNDRTKPLAQEGQECRLNVDVDILCGLPRHEGLGFCPFHLTEEDRPDHARLKSLLVAAVKKQWKVRSARLQGADLSGAQLAKADLCVADLRNANLHGVNLQEASLLAANMQGARLWHTTLQEARLWNANLQGADLTTANLLRADLRGAKLQHAILREANVQAATLWGACLRHADLEGTYLERADLSCGDARPGADLTGARLRSVRMSAETNLDGVTWGPQAAIRWSLLRAGRAWDVARQIMRWRRACDSTIALEAEADGLADYRDAARVYRQVRRAYEASGDRIRAGDFLYREMECGRKAAKPWSWPRVWSWFRWVTCGYLERPWRLAGTALLAVLGFAVFHAFLGLSGTKAVDLDLARKLPGWAELRDIGNALYFSAVTFTSLGYGDLRPVCALGKAFAASEAAVGAFAMALFLVTFTRKFQR